VPARPRGKRVSRRHGVSTVTRQEGTECDVQRANAVAALLAEPTITAPAEFIGVSRATVYRWLEDTAFQAAVDEARRRAFEAALRCQESWYGARAGRPITGGKFNTCTVISRTALSSHRVQTTEPCQSKRSTVAVTVGSTITTPPSGGRNRYSPPSRPATVIVATNGGCRALAQLSQSSGSRSPVPYIPQD